MDLLNHVASLNEWVVALAIFTGSITVIVTAWNKWVGPMIQEIRTVVLQASRVFDMMLSVHELPLYDGTVRTFDLPSAFVHLAEGQIEIVRWQQRHDERWPPEEEERPPQTTTPVSESLAAARRVSDGDVP